EFPSGFLQDVERKRKELLVAALTIWRWGRQTPTSSLKHGKSLGSFESWSAWVRDPLLTLGCPDPVDRLRQLKARDPHRMRVSEIFGTWWEHHAGTPVKASELHVDVKEAIDPGQKHTRNWQAARVTELVGTRQSGFVLEIFTPSGAGKRGTEYRL